MVLILAYPAFPLARDGNIKCRDNKRPRRRWRNVTGITLHLLPGADLDALQCNCHCQLSHMHAVAVVLADMTFPTHLNLC